MEASLKGHMQFYRIRDWAEHFENNRTRELKRMEWLPVPNKHDGCGFTELLDHPNGVAHYGAWHLILQVASKCDPRGDLLREGVNGIHVALTCGEIGRMSHSPAGLLQEAIDRLISIGWIEICEMSQEGAENPAVSCASRARAVPNGTERNGTEGNGNKANSVPSDAFKKLALSISNANSFSDSLEKGKGNGNGDWNGKSSREKMIEILGGQELAKRPDWLKRMDLQPKRIATIMDAIHSDLMIGRVVKNRGAYAETLWKKSK
jgi:hypothetical protein